MSILTVLLFSCQKELSYETGQKSKGSLQSSAGDCLPKTVNGTYTAGTALTDSNTIDVTVNVTQTGTYTIYTDTLNGYYFKAVSSFATSGSNTVHLKGYGKPLAPGTNTFTVTYDTSFCTVSVTVGGTGTGPVSTDHFILTDNSWWSYATPLSSTDTLKRTIIGSATDAGGYVYKAMKELNAGGQFDDTLYFRKSGNNYYNYNSVDYYADFNFYFQTPIADSILFLKEGLTTGTTWSSPVYTGTSNSGATTKLRFDFTCTNANATVSLNGKTYTNVYQVTMKTMLDSGSGFTTDVTWTNYYAQGIGWIYQKYDDGTSPYEITIRYYQVF